ncbi:hypothetical protein V9T40_010674 [Parthenolecanium corni]|uniref:Uncharacterized protein n=1 Tax=Parthenolecanium corni TaxID=536013 RepID=A0AAN9T7V1_9HEMI
MQRSFGPAYEDVGSSGGRGWQKGISTFPQDPCTPSCRKAHATGLHVDVAAVASTKGAKGGSQKRRTLFHPPSSPCTTLTRGRLTFVPGTLPPFSRRGVYCATNTQTFLVAGASGCGVERGVGQAESWVLSAAPQGLPASPVNTAGSKITRARPFIPICSKPAAAPLFHVHQPPRPFITFRSTRQPFSPATT